MAIISCGEWNRYGHPSQAYARSTENRERQTLSHRLAGRDHDHDQGQVKGDKPTRSRLPKKRRVIVDRTAARKRTIRRVGVYCLRRLWTTTERRSRISLSSRSIQALRVPTLVGLLTDSRKPTEVESPTEVGTLSACCPNTFMTKPITYSDAGVDIDAATRATDKIKELGAAHFQRANACPKSAASAGCLTAPFPT